MSKQQKANKKKDKSDDQGCSERSRSRQRHRIFQEDQQNEEKEHSEHNDNQEQQASGSNEQSASEEQEFSEKIALQIRSCYLDFFGQIKHEKGFVFTPQQRGKLQKQQERICKKDKNHQRIDWQSQCQWNLDVQSQRVNQFFDKQGLKLPQETIRLLKQIFVKSSYLFGNETTGQVYAMLMALLKISIRSGTQNSESQNEIRRFITEMRKETNNNFKFFNYRFSSYHVLPQEKDLQKQNENLQEIYFRLGLQIAKQLHKALTGE